jgi:hypothetical protein
MPPKVTRIRSIKVGSDLFKSTGVSRVKITKDGEAEMLELPICSTGIAELLERLGADEPTPPSKDELIEPGSPVGRQLKISTKTWVKMPNFTDPDYQERVKKHQTNLSLALLNQGLDLELLDEAGQPITDGAKKIEALKAAGLSMNQFTQIVNDIRDLTTITESDREHFFGVNSAAETTLSA